LGIIVSVMLPKIKSVLSISLGTVFAFFIMGALVSTTGDQTLRYFTPFKYFDFAYIVQNSGYESSFMIAAIGFIAIAITASYYIYSKSDIHAV
jgi:ABC-2 type transport system permease protein